MDLNYIRLNIKNKRRAAGITQREMSTKLFMDERTYSKIERGEKKSVDIGLLSSIADILGTDINTLMIDPAKRNDLEDVIAVQKANALQNSANEEQRNMMAEIKALQDEVRELILCHKQTMDLLKNMQD